MQKRYTMQTQRGISLIEVLAAIFVVSVGLLGVLAVIPFGAFQVSQAHHAGYASNMLVNACEEIAIREMAKPLMWGLETLSSGEGANAQTVLGKVTITPPQPVDPDALPIPDITVSTLNCTNFIWVEPLKLTDPAQHIFCVGTTFKPETIWTEIMRGQDDLDLIPNDDKRPALKYKENGKSPISSGKYTWFFTFLPKRSEQTNTVSPPYATVPGFTMPNPPKNAVPIMSNQYLTYYLADTADVDVLACYNRVPADDRQVQVAAYTPSFQGGSLVLPENADHWELLTQTQYVFVTWETTPLTTATWAEPELHGAWCKIVLLDKPSRRIVVTGELPTAGNAMYANIPSGVLYHKRLSGMAIK